MVLMVIKKPRCSKCNSSQVYTRQLTKERVCKQCGYIQKIESVGGKK